MDLFGVLLVAMFFASLGYMVGSFGKEDNKKTGK